MTGVVKTSLEHSGSGAVEWYTISWSTGKPLCWASEHISGSHDTITLVPSCDATHTVAACRLAAATCSGLTLPGGGAGASCWVVPVKASVTPAPNDIAINA